MQTKTFTFKTAAQLYRVWLSLRSLNSALSGPFNFIECGYCWEVTWHPAL
jgi:hypothetical protein